MLAVMMGFFALFGALGVPIVAALGLASALGVVLTTDLSLLVIVQRMAAQLDTFVLLAIPLFIFMAMVLERCGIADALYEMILIVESQKSYPQANELCEEFLQRFPSSGFKKKILSVQENIKRFVW